MINGLLYRKLKVFLYTTVRTRLEFSETDLRTVSGYDQFAVNSSQVEFLLTVSTNILVKHHPVSRVMASYVCTGLIIM